MKRKPIIPREQANRDVEDILAYYLSEASEAAALGFIPGGHPKCSTYGHPNCST